MCIYFTKQIFSIGFVIQHIAEFAISVYVLIFACIMCHVKRTTVQCLAKKELVLLQGTVEIYFVYTYCIMHTDISISTKMIHYDTGFSKSTD